MLIDAEHELVGAWRAAAADLGLSVSIDGGDDGLVLWAVRVADFGRAGGTVCRHRDAPTSEIQALREWAGRHDVFVSLLADTYLVYGRDLFVATLDDWGWHGAGSPPAWYSGKSW